MSQTPREYLVGLGLAKPGRGMFSAAAHAALTEAKAKGVVFAEPVKAPAKPRTASVKPKVSLEKAPAPKPAPPKRGVFARLVGKPTLRKQETRYAVTPEGFRIGFSQCFKPSCNEPLSRCDCKGGPTPPGGKDVKIVPTYPKV